MDIPEALRCPLTWLIECRVDGLCVPKAFVGRVLTDTIGRHVDLESIVIPSTCQSTVSRHVIQVGRQPTTTIDQYLVGLSIDTRPTSRPLRWIVGSVSVECRWCIDGLSVVYVHCSPLFCWNGNVSLPIGDAKEKSRRARENKLIFEKRSCNPITGATKWQ